MNTQHPNYVMMAMFIMVFSIVLSNIVSGFEYSLMGTLFRVALLFFQSLLVELAWFLLLVGNTSNDSFLRGLILVFNCFSVIYVFYCAVSFGKFIKTSREELVNLLLSYPFFADQLWCWKG